MGSFPRWSKKELSTIANMNEGLFFIHIITLVAFVLVSLKAGKETLIACFILQILIANLFVTKQMECFGLNVTCADVYTIGALFSLNLLQEYFGKAVAKRTVTTVFVTLLFFVVMAKLHLSYIPSSFDTMHEAFTSVLASSPRIIAASFLVTLLVQRIDVELFGFIKRRFPKQSLLLRFGTVSLVTQLIDTVLFSFLGLYGLVHSIGDIIVMSYLIKVGVILSVAPFTTLTKRFVTVEVSDDI